MMWQGMGGAGLLGALVMMFGGLLFLVLLVGLLVWLTSSVRRDGAETRPPVTRSTAVDIVRERYARGEITEDEYRRILADLET